MKRETESDMIKLKGVFVYPQQRARRFSSPKDDCLASDADLRGFEGWDLEGLYTGQRVAPSKAG